MSEAVEELIIGPMLALYPPPTHLRGDAARRAAALAEYRRTLDRFDPATLAAGWERVVAQHQFWVWPNPGFVVDCCARSLPPPPAVTDNDRRREQAVAMTDAYTARYLKTTQLARLARAEGWEPRLAEYVREAAWVQAQLICGVKPVGFATILIPPEHRHQSAKEAFTAYRETINGAIERARVRVVVPMAMIRGWKTPAGPCSVRAEANGHGRG